MAGRHWAPESWRYYPLLANSLRKIVDAGGRVGMGCHGDFWGIDCHVELWSYASGNMRPIDVLRSGTQIGADAIGLGDELGSLTVGKLADLQILDKNPLENIRNTNSVRYVMKDGLLYTAQTLDRIWPTEKNFPEMWWWKDDIPYADQEYAEN